MLNLQYFLFSKISQYSPTDSAKTYEKPCSRKNNNKFDPLLVLNMIKEGAPESLEDESYKKKIVQEYLDVRFLFTKNIICLTNAVICKVIYIMDNEHFSS